MSFDKDTRNLLARTVAACRRLLMEDVTDQLRGVFGMYADGTVLRVEKLARLTADQVAAARNLRELLGHYMAAAAGHGAERRRAAYERLVLEIGFTALNRLAALRLCEERGLVVECVRKGTASDGFRLFERVAGGALGTRYETYRVFLECIFDELALDLGVLFDRSTPQSAVFPTERCLEDVLSELDEPGLTHLWSEDETIGWIYQYFNPPEERKAMRDASQVPRNSHELAVRNQFFTPRYVVEFLADNTLGRIWYDMRHGATALKDGCRYLVRRSKEVFLKPGEVRPAHDSQDDELSQAELLRLPAYIDYRPKKDPRDLKILDPACGSGHFLLYAFDLLETVYEEAWRDDERPKSEMTGRTLQEDYPSLDDLRRAVPKLIIEHNLHGIDIDPRAVQIAALALWLRAQKSWRRSAPAAVQRPHITKSNIVCAEPMPGEEDMLREFTQTLRPRVLGEIVQAIFDRMKLAGEAGPLLKIEEQIKHYVAEAKSDWSDGPKPEQHFLFPNLDYQPQRQKASFDVRDVTDERFWEHAEERVLIALENYAEQAENGYAVRRRLFAGDAARGFSFIDVCRKRYDVLLMNPPFGSPAVNLGEAKEDYPNCGRDIYAMFVERMGMMRCPGGMIGAILPRTGLFIGTMRDLRSNCYLQRIPLTLLADLGKGVLDGATVRTACYVFGTSEEQSVVSLRIGNIEDRATKLADLGHSLHEGVHDQDLFFGTPSNFLKLPGAAIAYWLPSELVNVLSSIRRLGSVVDIRQGIATGDNFRFLRLVHELPLKAREKYKRYSKGGDPLPFISDEGLYVNAEGDCREMKANAAQKYGSASRTIKNEDTFDLPGITYSQVNDAGLKFRIHPQDSLYDMKGPVLFPRNEEDRGYLLAFLNTGAVEDFMRMMTDGRQWHVSALKQVPFPTFADSDKKRLRTFAERQAAIRQQLYRTDETSHFFTGSTCHLDYSNAVIEEDPEQEEVENIVWRAYGAREPDIQSFQRQRVLFAERDAPGPVLNKGHERCLISAAIGCIFGRWDIRILKDPSLAPKLPDPFGPLPSFSPGMLMGPDDLPAESGHIASEEWLRIRSDAIRLPRELSVISDSSYPIRICWDGILVDDPGWAGSVPHKEDIVRRVREVLNSLCGDKAHSIEQECCEAFGVSELRDYLREPSGFFKDHLQSYSKGKRKAPIYWPLSTASGAYTIWVYHPRLNDQTLYSIVNKYLEPKIAELERRLHRIDAELMDLSGREAARLRDRLTEGRALLYELSELREELARIAALPYVPDPDDGVLISAAPFHKLFRLSSWAKDTAECWNKLSNGDYDWAHLANAIWPDRVRKACRKDRSIAIAHGLEHLWESEPAGTKKRAGRKGKEAAG